MTAQELVKWITSNLKEDEEIFVDYDNSISPLTTRHLDKVELFKHETGRIEDSGPQDGYESLGEKLVIKSDAEFY